jgi:hypothetical protein
MNVVKMRCLVSSILCFTVLVACQQGGRHRAFTPPQQEQKPEPAGPEPESPPRQTPEKRRAFAARLWATSLGRLYQVYLFGSDSREDLPRRAREIVDRVYSDTNQTVAKVTALQALDEDLYVIGKVNDDVLARLFLLEEELTKGRRREEKSILRGIGEQIPFVFLATLPWGSPLLRGEVKNVFQKIGRRGVALIKREAPPPYHSVQWRRLGSREFFEDYEFGKALESFSKTAVPYALVEWVILDRKIEGSGEGLSQDELIGSANQ